jgi:predicted glycoside hydrolase/deacetylase ChbG (UPF0249 family)
MEIRLIIRGDDFGMTHSCNLAIENCFKYGVLTYAAIITPAPWAEEAAAMARAHPEWCIGAHLTTLGEWRGYRWRPVLPYSKVNTLVDKHGFLRQSPDDFFAKPIDYDQLEREFMAQLDLLTNHWGVNLGYADYHYVDGEKYGAPEYKQVMQRVAKAFGVPFYGSFGERSFRNIYFTEPEKKADEFAAGLDELEPGLWLSIHHLLQDDSEARALKYSDPADEMPGGSALHRVAEAAVLTNPAIRERIEARGIRLISYRDITP